jgi:hypothetical protein
VVNNELDMWKKRYAVRLVVPFRNFPGGTEENYENFIQQLWKRSATGSTTTFGKLPLGILIPSIVKTGQMFQKLKFGIHGHYGDLITLSRSLRKKSMLIMLLPP